MLSAEKANEALLSRPQDFYRPIFFERYRKPQVVEYPRHAVVLNPQHTQQQNSKVRGPADREDDTEDPLLKKKFSKAQDDDDDDPRFMDRSAFLCTDEQLEQVMHLQWKEIATVGKGLDNLGNTCFANAVLQAISYTPALAQYFAFNFRSADNRVGAPHDFAFALGETIRQLHLNNKGGGSYRPVLIMKHLRNLSTHFQLGRQCDAHEFAVQLLFSAQKSVLFRHVGATKLPHRITTTTALLRICGGFLLSQVSWSKKDEIEQLSKKGKKQEATDLQMEGNHKGQNGDKMYSNTYDPMTILTVELAGQTLEHCLEKFCEKEKLDGRCYHTPRDVGVKAEKQFFIHIPPNVLMIQVKRFSGLGGKAGKKIRYPVQLNIQPFCSPKTRSSGPLLYTLHAVCIHSGHSIDSGHYYSVVRARNGSWYKCNDSMVQLITEERALDQEAYMLFYSRVEPPAWNSTPEKPNVISPPQSTSYPYSIAAALHRLGEEEGVPVSEDAARTLAQTRGVKRVSSDLSPSRLSEGDDRHVSPKQRQRDESTAFASNQISVSQPCSAMQARNAQVVQSSALRSRLPPLDPTETPEPNPAQPQPHNAVVRRLFRGGVVASSKAYRTESAGGEIRRGGSQSFIPATLERPHSLPKFQKQVSDPLWQRSMDAGKQKKMKQRQNASDEELTRNRFQETSEQKIKNRWQR